MSDFIELMGYRIATEVPDVSFTSSTIINTINPHSYVVAERNAAFKRSLQESDILLPDGIGIVYAARILKGQAIPRITGPDFHLHLLDKLNKNAESCFYMGSSEETLKNIKERLKRDYQNIHFDYYSPPFKETFSKEDNRKMIAAVNQFQPDVLFVGMTAPKQEQWVYQHKNEIDANVICSVGAAFDFFAGTRQRSAEIWKETGLEWLSRFFREPQRLWKRSLISVPQFLKEVAKHKFN